MIRYKEMSEKQPTSKEKLCKTFRKAAEQLQDSWDHGSSKPLHRLYVFCPDAVQDKTRKQQRLKDVSDLILLVVPETSALFTYFCANFKEHTKKSLIHSPRGANF